MGLEKAVKYIQVAPLQNLVSLLAMPIVFESSKWILENYATQPKWATYFTIMSTLLVGAVKGNQDLAVEKFREYKKIKVAFEKYGWDEKIAETKSHSWCQRHATKVAAKDTGFGKEAKEYFSKR